MKEGYKMELAYAKDRYHFGDQTIDFRHETIVMGILNVTPDSFSDGGKYSEIDMALKHTEAMLKDGAKIIDIGGESTRPGHAPVSLEEELARTAPIIEAITNEFNCIVSIDTYKAKVAETAVQAGAQIINDVWGAKREPDIAKVAAKYGVPIILMHNREVAEYENTLQEDMQTDLKESIAIALASGVPQSNIWLDPGIGFAKDTAQNIVAMQNLQTIVRMGYPVLLGTSRKSLIGNVLNLPVEERAPGTSATVCYGIEKGCHIVRVHDVKEIAQAAKMMDVLVGKSIYNG